MKIAMATANFYMIPFDKTLNIIAKSGYEYIELGGYWKGGDSWEAAQHIKSMKPKEVINLVKKSGLKIAAYHDMGGVIDERQESIINPDTYEYLSLTDIPCVIFHTPHCKTDDVLWWQRYKERAIKDLYDIAQERIACIENMAQFKNYIVPLIEPKEMLEFTNEANIYCTIDTTHYAECNINISYAANVLKDRVKTIHLSDYQNGKSHLFIGDGELKFSSFYDNLNTSNLYMTTIECAIPIESGQMSIEKSKEAREFVEQILCHVK